MKALSRKLLRDLTTLRVQILTMALLIACGVAVLVASTSAYFSLQRAKDQYYAKFRFADVFADIVRAPGSLLYDIQKLPNVEIAEGRIVQDALMDIPGQAEPALGRIISWDHQQILNKIYLRRGRMPERGRRLEVLIHESFAKAHALKPGDSFKISIRGVQNTVLVAGIGLSPEYVYALSPLASFPDDLHFGILWMPSEDLERISNLQGAFNNLVVKIEKKTSLELVKGQINRILLPYGGLGAYDRIEQISDIFVEDEIRQQKSMSTLIPGIFILVAAFILHTVLSRLISLQRPQIATLKSLGYSSTSLAIYYWKLISIILGVGILPALLAAWGIGQWYAHLYERYFRFPKIDFSLSTESIWLGILAGSLPSWLATSVSLLDVFSLNPAEAMRPATPARFNQLFFKKTLFSSFKTQNKLIFRNILARPWRSAFSILGISAATAILINGSFWSDVMDYIIDQQFRQLHREDLQVQFLHPKNQEALSTLRKMEGVYMVQGLRSTGVRMTFQQFHKDTVLIAQIQSSLENSDLGLEPEPRTLNLLQRVLTSHSELLVPPDGQVILSQYFRKKFNLKAGDEITLQALDNTSPPFQVTVAGFVEEIVGVAIYANKKNFHNWLKENPSINAALLKIVPEKKNEIYLKLKAMPEVASINILKLVYQSFTETLSGMILTFTMILIFFAATISGAVLFNMARISLSEKAWELASLKILGYALFDVFSILHLEMGLQVIIALVPGCFLGYGLSFLSTKMIHTDIFNFPLVINIKTYALGMVVIVIMYFIAGIYLFRKITSLNMTAALKARE